MTKRYRWAKLYSQWRIVEPTNKHCRTFFMIGESDECEPEEIASWEGWGEWVPDQNLSAPDTKVVEPDWKCECGCISKKIQGDCPAGNWWWECSSCHKHV